MSDLVCVSRSQCTIVLILDRIPYTSLSLVRTMVSIPLSSNRSSPKILPSWSIWVRQNFSLFFMPVKTRVSFKAKQASKTFLYYSNLNFTYLFKSIVSYCDIYNPNTILQNNSLSKSTINSYCWEHSQNVAWTSVIIKF